MASEYYIVHAFRIAHRTLLVMAGQTLEADYLKRTLVDLDGTTIAAMRFARFGRPACTTSRFAGFGDDIAFELSYDRYDSTGSVLIEGWERIYRARADDVVGAFVRINEENWTEPDLNHPGGVIGGGTVSALALGSDFAAYVISGGLSIAEPDGTTEVVSRPMRILADTPFVVGADVLWGGAIWLGTGSDESAPLIAQSIGGGPGSVLHAAPGDDRVLCFGADAGSVGWIETEGFSPVTETYDSLALWSGIYDTATSTLSPRRLRSVPSASTDSAVGAGYFVQPEADPASSRTVYAVYRLSDGARATFDPVGSGGPSEAAAVLVVTTEEIVFLAGGVIWRVDPRLLSYVT